MYVASAATYKLQKVKMNRAVQHCKLQTLISTAWVVEKQSSMGMVQS